MSKKTETGSKADQLSTTGSGRLHKFVMPDVDLEKREFVRKQTMQAMKSSAVNCSCEIEFPLWLAFRCLYCGVYFCQKCAEKHFGKTRAQHLAEKEQRRCSGYKVFPGGEKCNGCSDCQQQA
ncbi:MAG: hypothetical protein JRE23_00035 [Deltaproteobacteria bacterium]|nr:hypothetical protein [Deltaproteobacteria bacterium]